MHRKWHELQAEEAVWAETRLLRAVPCVEQRAQKGQEEERTPRVP